MVWAVQTAAAGDGEAIDPALSAAQTVTDTAKGTANQLNQATIAAFSPGWGAGKYTTFKVYRDADAAADTMAGDARLVNVKIEYAASVESD